jgi:nicotinate (nicotinamide) nucleotide adenylyltransferase
MTVASNSLTIGVFGGSFNPVHLGHALLAITTQQTKSVDQVVLVPVYKHAVKQNLLPFHDRVQMCQLAIASFGDALTVSTIEEQVGASNGEMLKALKKEYPPNTRFLWICGDDFIRWMDKPKGIETLKEVSGLIVQRRLHKQSTEGDNHNDFNTTENRFVQEPLDELKLRRVADQLNLKVEFIYGELPHFSSTLVRRAPGHWRSFLSTAVVQYLDERPHLLQQLMDNLEEDMVQNQQHKKTKRHNRSLSTLENLGKAGTCVLQGLDFVNALQLERGRTGLALSTGAFFNELKAAQVATDARLQVTEPWIHGLDKFPEVMSLVAELQRAPAWLRQDRQILKDRSQALSNQLGVDGWIARLALVQKFNGRIDVLIGATVRALVEILENHHETSGEKVNFDVPELLLKWCEGKEALGRLRAFVCAAGQEAPQLVKSSLKMRERLIQTIETKERCLSRVWEMEVGLSSKLSSPDALHKLLQNVTIWEYKLMGSFAPSTPLPLIHKFLDQEQMKEPATKGDFDVEKFFEASSSAIDFLLSFGKALTASACANG